ncbi:ion transporter [Congregibacter litoralis]|uniref:Ion transport protein n=1 Tax=Congregibacter litoralis KT71 TaxID=314285 RepID=A4A7J5_9GAMM|nr:ion transporter [Congregibacter litoralis]EAQ98264.2 Ion transport protein [Congregibacter litoralis KT71]
MTDQQTLAKLRSILEQPLFQRVITVLIIINAVVLGLETSPEFMTRYGVMIHEIDTVILFIFVLEIAARVIVYGKKFWRDPWSVFDFAVVAIALIPATGPLAVLRTLRVLRVLRLLTLAPSMRKVVGALLSALPGLASIGVVLIILYYVAAVIATGLFSTDMPTEFGNLGRTFFTLFQVMTLESWASQIARPAMEHSPMAWLFFVIFILGTTFTMLNLFIGIIVDAVEHYTEQEVLDARDSIAAGQDQLREELGEELESISRQISRLQELAQQLKKE